MLRINTDGTIPTDNPFFTHGRPATTAPSGRSACATRSRSPSSPAGAEMFINDVGQNTWEEINDGVAGANYGWPTTEGPTTDPSSRARVLRTTTPAAPVRDHRRRVLLSADAAIPVGVLAATTSSPTTAAAGFGRLDRAETVTDFATGIAAPVDLKVSDDGRLYYLARGRVRVGRVGFTARPAPGITTHPASQTVAAGAPLTFSVRASGHPPLRISGSATAPTSRAPPSQDYTIASVVARTTAPRSARVSNDFGNVSEQ